MSIRDKIVDVQNLINDQWISSGGTSSAKAIELQEAAAAAILLGGDKVEAYMRIFTDDETELAKMMPDITKPPHLGKNLARAYLMGTGPCGPASPQGPALGLLFGVGDILDEPDPPVPVPVPESAPGSGEESAPGSGPESAPGSGPQSARGSGSE